jgi:ABC-type phosphate transport system ATPase subunit
VVALGPCAPARVPASRTDGRAVLGARSHRQRVADVTAFFSVDISQGNRTGYLVECGPTRPLFESPREQLTKEYVSGQFS